MRELADRPRVAVGEVPTVAFPTHDSKRTEPEPPQGVRSCRDAALWYASRGWRVIPLWAPIGEGCSCPRGSSCSYPGKHPLTTLAPNGSKDGTTNAERIHSWWGQEPTANVAIVLGPESGLCALDVDPRHGSDETLRELVAEHGELPETPKVITGGGGTHLYLEYPGGERKNRNIAGHAVQLKFNGYMVAPPSLHKSGQRYVWAPGYDPTSRDLRFPPEWLLEGSFRPAGAPTGLVPVGTRNNHLASYAGRLRKRGLCREELLTLIHRRNRLYGDPPAPGWEVEKVADSVSRYPVSPPHERAHDSIQAHASWVLRHRWTGRAAPQLFQVALGLLLLAEERAEPDREGFSFIASVRDLSDATLLGKGSVERNLRELLEQWPDLEQIHKGNPKKKGDKPLASVWKLPWTGSETLTTTEASTPVSHFVSLLFPYDALGYKAIGYRSWHLWTLLRIFGPLSVADLADHVRLRRTSVAGYLRDLKTHRLVTCTGNRWKAQLPEHLSSTAKILGVAGYQRQKRRKNALERDGYRKWVTT